MNNEELRCPADRLLIQKEKTASEEAVFSFDGIYPSRQQLV